MELPGADRLSLPAALSSRLVTDPPKTVTQPVPQIEMPAIAAAAGIDTAVGVVSALPVVNSDSQGPGAGGAAGTGKGTGNGPGSGPGLGDGRDGGTGGDVYRDGSGVVSPRLIREVRPLYTSDAMRAKVQGVVGIEAVVLADGSVGKAQVVRSLDTAFGLDEEALRTVRQWRFAPGRRSGQPVAVMVLIEMAFTLR
jgi:protein TonB